MQKRDYRQAERTSHRFSVPVASSPQDVERWRVAPACGETLEPAFGRAQGDPLQDAASNFPKNEWRCAGCSKLLGIGRDGRLHLRFARGHEYLVGFPVQATCRGCGTLNHASAPAR